MARVELQATLRPEAQQIIQQLKRRKLDLYIISGYDQGANPSAGDGIGH